MTMLTRPDEGSFQRRATWEDAQAAIGGLMLSSFGEWEDDEQSSARFVCPACGLPEALQLWPDGQDGKIGRQCLEGCKVGDIDAALLDTYGLRMRPMRPRKPRGEPLQAAPLETLHASQEGDARRLIQAHGPRLLLVSRPGNSSACYVLDTDTGIWSDNPDALFELHCETAKSAAQIAVEKHMSGELSAALQSEMVRWAKRTHCTYGSANAGLALKGAYLGMLHEGREPAIGGIATAAELDADKRYLGTASGIVDLDTGELLTPDIGAAKRITRSTGVEYRPDAQDDVIDALLGHLDTEERDYLLDAAAYTLRGNPARRWYVLVGPPGSGKTTFLNALGAALGDSDTAGYHIGLAPGALLNDKNASSNAHSDHLKNIPYARLATGNELPDNGARFNEGLIKDLTGGGFLTVRELGKTSTGAKLPTTTLIMAINPKQLDRLSLIDSALAERTAILNWPPFPPGQRQDTNRVTDVTHAAPAQAMLAELIRRARTLNEPPAMPASVASAVEDKRAEGLGVLGAWLAARVVITGVTRSDYIQPDALWTAAYEELEGDADKIGGVDRRGLPGLLREVLPGLPAQKPRRISGKLTRAWVGVKLLTAEEAAAAEDAPEPDGAEFASPYFGYYMACLACPTFADDGLVNNRRPLTPVGLCMPHYLEADAALGLGTVEHDSHDDSDDCPLCDWLAVKIRERHHAPTTPDVGQGRFLELEPAEVH